MQAYRVFIDCNEEETTHWFGTRADAHAYAKTKAPRLDVIVELVEIPVDRDTVLGLLNWEPGKTFIKETLRTYVLTERGGLKEEKRENIQTVQTIHKPTGEEWFEWSKH